jgi:FKBP-type peptidyl-prolyl cis-trans isomerase (trigger factor)
VEQKEETKIVVIVNGIPLMEREIENYMGKVARNRLLSGKEDLSRKELRDKAIEEAIMNILLEEYLGEEGIKISPEEIEEKIILLVEKQPGIETKEEFIEFMAVRGISKEEVELDAFISIAYRRLSEVLAKEIEVDKETVSISFLKYVEGFPSLEEIEDTLIQSKIKDQSEKMLLDNLSQRKKEAEIEIIK